MVKRILALCLPVLTLAACSSGSGNEAAATSLNEWKPLWNGHDLTEWEVVGPADWQARDGVISVRRNPDETGGSWLVTRRQFADFRLRFRFQWDAERGNSGILIRDPGHAKVGRPAYNGYEIQIFEGQGDSEKNPTGSIYDVARAFSTKMDPAVWTEFQIDCVGDRITTYMNGQKLAEAHSRQSFHGAIGLQLHGGRDPEEYRWKDLEIMELIPDHRPRPLMEEWAENAPGDFVNLLDGKSLEGDMEFFWEGGARWTLQDGVLRGEHPREISWLFTKEVYRDFILSFDFRISPGGNGGAAIRVPWPEAEPRTQGPAFLGYELQIGDLKGPNPTGTIYGLARAFAVDACGNTYHREQGWNHYRIYARGDHIVTYLNRRKMAETHSDRSFEGRIGFQAHEPTEWVEYRNIQLKVLR